MKLIPLVCCSALLLSAEPKHLGNIRQLTEGGQNAEAYWSPDGKRLIFQSTRPGYECDQIFIMNADGSDQKLISTGKGRTTCAYFLADGKHILYASTHEAAEACPTPLKMELMVSDADGSHTRQITNFGCASFAPSFTPDGKKIVFASNKNECDSRHFELFLINVDGTGLEQVTSFGGFTSFPEFSPDGKKVVFCSDRGAKERYEFNIFTADWK